MDYIDEIYASLQGVLIPEAAVPWVENMFRPGAFCEQEYARMLAAYARLVDRLGVKDEDPDVEIIIDSLLSIQDAMCRKMFLYGMEHTRRNS